MNIGMNASTRERSVGLRWWLDRITTKYTTAARRLSQITIVDNLLAVITWVRHNTTTRAARAARPAAYGSRRAVGSGSTTSWVLSGRRLRPIEYWISPIAIPTAARAKPTWKP